MKKILLGLLILLAAQMGRTATPPSLVNYQGTLHDSNDQPLSGTFDMVFRFFDASSGGNLLLTDSHSGGGGVVVTAGLFNVALGSGTITPGTESTLGGVFANHGTVYLELQVGVETLAPRVHLISSAYSLNAGTLNGLTTGNASGNIPVNDGTLNSSLNAGMLGGLAAGNASGNVAVNNGMLNTDLNADLLDGLNTGNGSGNIPINNGALNANLNAAMLNGSTAGNGSGNLAVNNGTVNTNLNADMLDGLHSTSFAASVHTHSAADIVSGTLPAMRGGTGSDTSGAVTGSILRAAGGGTWSALAPGSEGQILAISSGMPAWVANPGITGSGTTNFLPKFLGSNNIGNSVIAESGGKIGIGTTAPGTLLEVDGTALFSGANSFAFAANGPDGIVGKGTEAGGLFADLDNTGYAWVGYGNRGIEASGTEAGGHFKDSDSSGDAYIGYGDFGIFAGGSYMGGYFYDTDANSSVNLANGAFGMSATGTSVGGFFDNISGSGYAYTGYLNDGIDGYGTYAGGYFKNASGSAFTVAGFGGTGGDYGIEAYGTIGGIFGYTNGAGGYSYVGSGNYAIEGFGYNSASRFVELNGGETSWVASTIYKIIGTGVDSFVQNHPTDADKSIVYVAPEGDEVATYTRGTARLQGGVARVPLGDTFKWVTNPDVGLTGYVTPREDCKGIYIESITPSEMVVREVGGGTGSSKFDYIVYGLRIGFEEAAIVQKKENDAPIPSLNPHRKMYEENPELRQYDALERFKGMRAAAGDSSPLDLRASQQLHDAIHEFDPATDKIQTNLIVPVIQDSPRRQPESIRSQAPANRTESPSKSAVPSSQQGNHAANPPQAVLASPEKLPMDSEGNLYAKSFRSASDEMAKSMPVSQQVELGDVVVVDRSNHGWLKLGDTAADSAVVGVISSDPGVLLGGKKNSAEQKDTAKAPVALSGIVKCKVDASYGAIQVGDLLTTSPTPGFAMKAVNAGPGTILGKALDSLDSETGLIEILIMHQ